MPSRNCELCGIKNNSSRVTVFDLSKRKIYNENSKYNFLCKNHYDKDDIHLYSDGEERYKKRICFFIPDTVSFSLINLHLINKYDKLSD